MIAVRIVHGVTGHFMVRFVEWLNSAILLNFAITLLRPGSTFNTSHSYDTMARLASENTWGYWLLTISVARILSLVLNGTFGWFKFFSPWARVVLAYLSAFAWFVISAGLFWGNTQAPGPGTYFLHMAADIFIAGVIAREAARTSVRPANVGS